MDGRLPRCVVVLVVLASVLLSGCAAPVSDGPTTGRTDSTAVPATTDVADDGDGPVERNRSYPADDPPEDRLGWESGYWYNESVDAVRADGYDEAELQRLANRTMARLELIRGLEFARHVDVEFVTPEEAPDGSVAGVGTEDRWTDQFYEATFFVNESTASADAFDGGATYGGYYSDGVVYVVTQGSTTEFGEEFLAHELTHALQDQRGDLSLDYYGSFDDSYDGRRAASSPIEGEASLVQEMYGQRCMTEWECEPIPSYDRPLFMFDSREVRDPQIGLRLVAAFPYDEGVTFVHQRYREGGWDAVDALFTRDRQVETTAGVIHPKRPPEREGQRVTLRDQSAPNWERYRNQFDRTSERVGEAWLFAMLWRNGVVAMERADTTDPVDSRVTNFSHPATAGWVDDELIVLRNGSQDGYVWRLRWESPDEARQFEGAYLSLLEAQGAREVEPGVYRIPENESFADAFRVQRDGDTLTVVNAPTVEQLDEVRPER